MVKSMEINKLSDAFTKTGSIDLSKWDFPKYHLPEIEIPTVETIDPEDTNVRLHESTATAVRNQAPVDTGTR